jgi:hypothetical protein
MKIRKSAGFFTGLAAVLIALFILLANIGLLLVGLSVMTSGVKAVSGNCGTTYGIESYAVGGDWFCPKEVKDDTL